MVYRFQSSFAGDILCEGRDFAHARTSQCNQKRVQIGRSGLEVARPGLVRCRGDARRTPEHGTEELVLEKRHVFPRELLDLFLIGQDAHDDFDRLHTVLVLDVRRRPICQRLIHEKGDLRIQGATPPREVRRAVVLPVLVLDDVATCCEGGAADVALLEQPLNIVLIEQIVVQILHDGRMAPTPPHLVRIHVELVLHAVLELGQVPHEVVLRSLKTIEEVVRHFRYQIVAVVGHHAVLHEAPEL
mmetsp:Transcript_16173/g.45844  ORF Transcript_16173/g.45844 Transcript_16173/m.45844 type:complete len:244 (+) Transcript_16173:896-1627(+)